MLIDKELEKRTREDTLKEVGEWMENHKLGWHAEANGKILEITSLKDVDELYQALLRGEVPSV